MNNFLKLLTILLFDKPAFLNLTILKNVFGNLQQQLTSDCNNNQLTTIIMFYFVNLIKFMNMIHKFT